MHIIFAVLLSERLCTKHRVAQSTQQGAGYAEALNKGFVKEILRKAHCGFTCQHFVA